MIPLSKEKSNENLSTYCTPTDDIVNYLTVITSEFNDYYVHVARTLEELLPKITKSSKGFINIFIHLSVRLL